MTERGQNQAWSARAGLLHPAWWLATGLLLLNDHYLKGAGQLAPWLTGKLSDFAGMMMAPLVLAALLAPRSRPAFLLAHVLVGVAFSALKLSSWCAAVWCEVGALLGLTWQVVCDPSDLLALPVLGLSHWLFGPGRPSLGPARAWQGLATALAHGVGFVSIVATSRLPPPEPVLGPRPQDKVYVGYGGELREFERDTGKATRSLPCRIHPYRGTRFNGQALFSIEYRTVIGCDLPSGRVLWTRELERAELVHADDERVILRTPDAVLALGATTGKPLWQRERDNEGAAVLPEHVVVRLPDGSLQFLALHDGSAVVERGRLGPGFVTGGGAIYGFDSNELLVLDGAGQVRARRPHSLVGPERLQATPDTLIAHSQDGTLTGIDRAQLRPLWQLANAELAALTSHVAVTHRRTGCNDNTLDARDVRTGRRLWHVPWCPYSASVAADETLLLTLSEANGHYELAARDPESGRPLWHTALDD